MLFYLQLGEMQEASNARHQKELAQVREATAREMKHYYLQCLHQLVNGHTNTNGLHSGYQPADQPHIPVHPPSSMVENLRPNSQEAYHSEGDVRGTMAAMSTQVWRTRDSNSHAQVPAERRTKKGTVSGKRQKSTTSSPGRKLTSGSSSSPSKAQLSAPSHHHYKTNASSSRKAVVGRLCKNADASSSGRHQSVHVKGGIHRSTSGSGGAASSAVKKDLLGRSSTGKRGSSSNGLVHSSDGVRESKSVTGGKLKTSKR